MSLSKRRKVDSECRIFEEKWTEHYFCIANSGKVMCLICKGNISVFKEYNIRRHYDSKHKSLFDKYDEVLRKDNISNLVKGFASPKRMFTKHIEDNLAAVLASYRIFHILATKGKPFSDGEFVKN